MSWITNIAQLLGKGGIYINITDIDYVSMTWNPITGCLEGCSYCYGVRIAKRFGSSGTGGLHVLDRRQEKLSLSNSVIADPFPHGFDPTFHKYRLNDPKKKSKPLIIFTCSMADLFGSWVPAEWISDVLKTMEECTQHTFLLLTKSPGRYKEFVIPDNCWCGTTITKQQELDRVWDLADIKNSFVSIEPLLEEIDFGCMFPHWIRWVIVGAQTGPKAIKPSPVWVDKIIYQSDRANVPVFLKRNLEWTTDISEYPVEISLKRAKGR